jgi:uncharacterized protein (DUF983 family)
LAEVTGPVHGPFDDLDPPVEVLATERPGRPGPMSVLVRGARRRCPRCGDGTLFASWFRIRPRCPRCGLRLEREEGGFLGAMVLNYVATAVLWLAVLIGWLVVDLPDVHVAALMTVSIAIAILAPLLLWRTSKTLWASVDYLVYRSDPDYAARDAADRSGGNGGRP